MKTETIGKTLLVVGLVILAYALLNQSKLILPQAEAEAVQPTMDFGVLKVSAQSVMPSDYKYISFNIDKMEVLDHDGRWSQIISNAMPTELGYIQNSETLLGSAKLESGEYNKVRIYISGVKYTTMSGLRGQLRILNDAPIEVSYDFEIFDGETTELRLIFDASDSIDKNFFNLNVKTG
jgi:hypothetical protein